MTERVCPKCRRAMELGFIVDQAYGEVAQPEWAEGPVQRSVWTGVKMKGRRRLAVQTFRRTGCGYLESYAT